MAKIAIMTDTNSGIVSDEAQELGIALLSMPFIIDSKTYFEGVDITHTDFYEILKDDVEISTSQPAPASLCDMWDSLLDAGFDEIVYIPMSSALSKACETAKTFAKEYDGKVVVVDNQRISATQRQSVLDAVKLKSEGKSAAQIKEILERDRLLSSIYITVDTLKYLKKGGRVTATAAAIGTVLNIKPVLQIQGEKLDSYAKIRGFTAAKKTMIDAIKSDINTRFASLKTKGKLSVAVAHTCSDSDIVDSFIEEVKQELPDFEIYSAPLALSIACHVGPGALGIAISIVE